MANINLKLRLSIGHSIAMGPGKADLLETIAACGSISSAAKQMKMSYRRAWELVDLMNKCFKQPVVTTSPGGAHGGGAQVTEFGMLILKSYRDMVRKANAAATQEINFINTHIRLPEQIKLE